MIRSKGTYTLFTAPYLAALNPIELGYNIYKTNLKKNLSLVEIDWYDAYLKAIDAMTPDITMKEFCKCRIPKSNKVQTSEEKKKILLPFNILLDN